MKTARHAPAAVRTARSPLARLRPTAAAAQVLCHGAPAGRPQMLATSVLGLVLLGLVPWSDVLAQAAPQISRTALPTPCSATASCGPAGNLPFVQSGAATAATAGNRLTVTQSTGTSLLNWQNFNVGADSTVNFTHTNPAQAFTSINRIHDSTLSTINGRIAAPLGQIYLINPNGLLFNGTARVDVSSLIASTLDVSNTRAQLGLLKGEDNTAAFALQASNPQALAAAVNIDRGAVISAGNVFVFAPTVNNAGSIQVTPGGQVVLAAGQRVFLGSSDSATLRGLLVEVGQGGTVTNSGDITTPRGNTSLVGMAVNQTGRITATSALYENGSIYLRAREVASDASGVPSLYNRANSSSAFTATKLNPTAAGSVTLSAGSQTRVLLDEADTATAALTDDNAARARSTIVVDGLSVQVQGSATENTTLLQARGGDISLNARSDADAITGTRGKVLGAENAAATLSVGENVTIDVSGERDVAVDGERNFVYIERLTSNDLRDAPAQRDGFLRGQGVHVNVAQPQAFIDLSSRKAAVAGTQAERNATAGTIALRAEGRVDVAASATLDVTGGNTLTSAATGRTSQLLTVDGRIVDVMQAKATEQYVGFADRVTTSLVAPREGVNSVTTSEAPRFTGVAAIAEGKSAGSVEITAPRGSVAGQIEAQVQRAPGQRSDATLLGGELRIGSVAGSAATIDAQAQISRANVVLTTDLAGAAAAVAADQRDRLIAIDTAMLKAAGVQRLNVVSDGALTVTRDATLDLGVRGEATLQANAVDVQASITAQGGKVVLGERPATSGQGERDARNLVTDPALRGSVNVGRGVVLDVSGTFNNDAAAPGALRNDAVARDAGSITVSGRSVNVAEVQRLDVTAGASVSASGTVTGGRAGELSLVASNTQGQGPTQPDLGQLVLGADFAQRIAGHGFASGGALTLGAPTLTLGSRARGDAVQVTDAMLDRGFERYTLQAGDALSVQGLQSFAPVVRQLVADTSVRTLADGARLSSAMTPQAPLAGRERPVQLNLQATRELSEVTVETGASIDAGALGRISASAGQRVLIDGSLRAAGGTVSAALRARDVGATYLERWSSEQAATRAVQLGDSARIDVSGTERVQTDVRGLRSGVVLDGGTVSLDAVQGHLAIGDGAVVRADGTRGQVDMLRNGALTRTPIASRGGAVSLSAMQSLQVNGEVTARSGDAATVEGGRLSVRFNGLPAEAYKGEATAAVPSTAFTDFFSADRVLTLGGTPAALPLLGAPFEAAQAGRGQLGTGLFADGGFDSIWLASANTVATAGSLTLAPRASLTIDAQALRVAPDTTLSIRTPGAVALGSQQATGTFAPNLDAAASGGSGRLAVEARSVELVGRSVLQGVGQTEIRAADDVQLRGVDPTGARVGGALTSGGDLRIVAAQLTPATQTDFRIAVTDTTAGRIRIEPTAVAVPLAPLSAGGSVALSAPLIDVTGRITAPHGAIDLDAGERLTVGPTATLSVAGSQAVPFGTVFNGSQWVYSSVAPDVDDTSLVLADGNGVTLLDKRIRLKGATVDVDPAARLDLRGGGDLVAQEFTAGPGGSTDVRLNCVATPCTPTGTRNPLFALIPARGSQAAPFDPMIQADLTQDAARGGNNLLRVGQTLTIAAGSEIPAGSYTVLPARYAVLPGAYALQAVTGYTDLQPGSVVPQAGGTPIVAGRLGMAGAGLSSDRWSGYRVYNAAQFRQLAELRDHSANTFMPIAAAAAGEIAPRLPADAAALSVVAAGSVRLSTDSIRAAAATGGRGAELAFSAPHIEVTDRSAATLVAATPSDTLALGAQALSALSAETLVLGAAVSHGDGSAEQRDRLTLTDTAQDVRVGGLQTLKAGEVLLAARDAVRVGVGAGIAGDSAQAPRTRRIEAEGDGAALLVSQADTLPVVARSNQAGVAGTLAVAESAQLTGRSVLFDASSTQTYASSVLLQADNLGLSAATINLGDGPAGAAGLTLGNALLTQLAAVDKLTLTSGSVFNVQGAVQVGSATMNRLTLDGAGVVAAPSGSATFTAGDLVLRNSAATAPTDSAAPGTGALALRALGGNGASGNVELSGGAMVLQGFAQTTVTATGEPSAGGASRAGTGQIDFSGTGSLTAQGDVTLDAARISAGRAAQQGLEAQGVLSTRASSSASTETATDLAATLALRGQRIEHGGRIELPSGAVTLEATGSAAQDDVALLAGSRLSVGGSTQAFAGQSADASAGSAVLRSASGSVRAAAGSSVDISGAGTKGDAGALTVRAENGTLQLDGTVAAAVNAAPGSSARGAQVSADVKTLPSLDGLAGALDTQALQALTVRVREGDVALSAGQTLKARNVHVAADGARVESTAAQPRDGQLRIDGTLDAAGARAGRVELWAADSATLGAGARIDASSSGAGEEGGTVLLSARIQPQASGAARDAIRIEQGARVDVSGGSGASGGTVTLRAPRITSAAGVTDVAVRGVGAAAGGEALPADYVVGARQEIVEATVVSEQTGNVTLTPSAATGTLATLATTLKGTMDAASRSAMAERLARSGSDAANFKLRPGLEVRTAGNISVTGVLDFTASGANGFAWRYGGTTLDGSEPGALTLRAGGNLTVSGGLQDGFRLTTTTGTGTGVLNTVNARLVPFAQADSWRYQLTGGADLGGAAASAVRAVPGANGDVLFNQVAGAVAQTRTGTGRIDVAAARDILLTGQNVAVFTGGTASVPAPVFQTASAADLSPTFTEHGGGVTLAAGNSITATAPRQLVNNWLWRSGKQTDGDFTSVGNSPTAWWVNAATFAEGVGALGGGDLTVTAGNDITSLSTAVPGNAYLDTASQQLVSHNRGELSVRAGDTLTGGVHYAQDGALNLRAERIAESTNNPVIVAQGNNVATARARGDATVFGAFNPTWAATLPAQSAAAPAFSTYGERSAFEVSSLAGTVLLKEAATVYVPRSGAGINNVLLDVNTVAKQLTFSVLPPTVDLLSFGGDVALSGRKLLAPDATGQLRLLASDDVAGGGGALTMMDLDPHPTATSTTAASIPTPFAPVPLATVVARSGNAGSYGGSNLNSTARHADLPEPLHSGDTSAVAVVARSGGLAGLSIDVPKPIDLTVAGDITGNTRISAQNLDDASVSRIRAGGRIDASALAETSPIVQISGPGVAEVLAGGAIDLAKSDGIVTRGNLYNPALPEAGATLIVAAGTGRGADGFAQSPDYAGVLANHLRSDPFASAGRDAGTLNASVLTDGSWAKVIGDREADQVLDATRLRALIGPAVLDDAALQTLVAPASAGAPSRVERARQAAALVWQQALQSRGTAAIDDYVAWAQSLGTATRMRLAIELAQRVQAVSNQRFVATTNTETFAPGYIVLRDLFPTLAADATALRHFVANNPFAGADNAEALRRDVVAALDGPLAALLALGLDDPSGQADPASAFNRGLAALDATTLARFSRAMMAGTQQVAGTALDSLRQSRRVDASVGTPFARGLDELARAFAPVGAVGSNGIALTQSQIRTEQVGDLAVLAPRGGVLLGLTAEKKAGSKTDDKLGLLSFGGGSIVGMVRDNFDVNKSRAFTVAGGDIHLWASQGNVDAGRGPRDATVAPPPLLNIDAATGEVTIDVSASVSGSGIGALVTKADQPPSAIRLIAPNGFIDAGEAGIRADGGSVTLGTNVVLNAGNISAGGAVSGGAVVVAPPAPLPASTASGNQADKAVEQTQKTLSADQKETEERAKRERRKRVTGEFIGFGDD
jgi:filamentous hemagglutinin